MTSSLTLGEIRFNYQVGSRSSQFDKHGVDHHRSRSKSNSLVVTRKHSKRRLSRYKTPYDDIRVFQTSMMISHLVLNNSLFNSPQGRQLDLSSQQLARQLRGAFEGRTLQTFYEDGIEVDVLLSLSEIERNRLATLDQLPIVTPGGTIVPLPVVAAFEARRGLDKLRRTDGQISIVVSADVNNLTANAAEILTDVRANALPEVTAKYGLKSTIQGRAQDREETFADMKVGVLVALAMIYIILAWVFSSYSWPFAVLIAIPLGLTGAIGGHWLMGLDLTVLSLFGFFGLSGIVINDSIVLVDTYRRLIQAGEDHIEAIVKASCLRFRAVLVTSLTTIAGLTPILFETSPQAQFLIPMATTIVFGLAYGTVLVLMIVPSVLSLIERNRNRTSVAHSEYSVAEEPTR